MGDVNGDGIDDIATVALSGRAAYVVFGQRERMVDTPIDLMTFHLGIQGDAGFRFDLSRTATEYSVAAGGDVNGDGLDDVVVGVDDPEATTFVAFGKESTTAVNSRSLGRRGIKIPSSGTPSAGVGDVNGDGLGDLVVGVTVVFGQRRGGTINRSRHGYDIRLDVQDIAGRSAEALGPAGDVNGDGLADVLFATPYSDHNRRRASGSVYVLYGKKGRREIDLARLGSDGYRIDGARAGDYLGGSGVAVIGDVSRDRVPDHLLAAPGPDGRRSGAAHIVWGRRQRT